MTPDEQAAYEKGHDDGENSATADFLIALTEADLFPDDGRPFGPMALVAWLTPEKSTQEDD